VLSPLVTSCSEENFRPGLLATPCQLPQLRGQRIEGRLNFANKGLPKDFPMLGLSRAPVPGRATLQSGD
jgi:hypothetical protein